MNLRRVSISTGGKSASSRSRLCNAQAVFLLAVLMSATGTLMGQGSGTSQGTVKDPLGAVIPQAEVVAVNAATGVRTTRATTGAGLFVLSPLPAGEYDVTVKAPGFQTLTQQHIVVESLATVGLDLELKVGAASD